MPIADHTICAERYDRLIKTRRLSYRKDDGAMRPIYGCMPWKLYVSAKSADSCTRIATLQSYHYSVVKSFSKCSNQCDQGT